MEAKRRPSVGSQGASWPVVRAAALRHALAVAHSGVVDESRSEQDGAPPLSRLLLDRDNAPVARARSNIDPHRGYREFDQCVQ